jgi:arabinose-5-phosphate isomerase
MTENLKTLLLNSINTELNSIEKIATEITKKLGEEIIKAIELIGSIKGNVIISGLGKSGHICNKISATLSSTGTPSIFLHASEANHGDIGIIKNNDVLMILSNSGETAEFNNIVNYAKKINIPIVSITGNQHSFISTNSDIAIVLPEYNEAGPINLVPTTSTTLQLIIGDLIAIGLMYIKEFSESEFKLLHPSGKIGANLLNVEDVMHVGENIPLASQVTNIDEVILIMTNKRFGCIGLTDEKGILTGIITDGDLRRSLHQNILNKPASDIMTHSPITIEKSKSVTDAVSLMNSKKITCLFVTQDDKPQGIVHLHDLIKLTAL